VTRRPVEFVGGLPPRAGFRFCGAGTAFDALDHRLTVGGSIFYFRLDNTLDVLGDVLVFVFPERWTCISVFFIR
jgi:hypothetical protein